MGQQHIQTRVPDDLADRIDTYQEHEEYMNDAEALRALLRAGLDAEGYAEDGVGDDEGDTGTGEPTRTREAHSMLFRPVDILQVMTLILVAGLYGVAI
jgi:Arc/MetJ-type ribon-helix-helix transcriptional regulator